MRTVLGPALRIAAKDLRVRLRDRSALIVAFVAPLVLATIISLALGGTSSFSVTLAVADLDGSDVSRAFVDGIRGATGLRDVVKLRDASDAAAAEALVRGGTVSAGIVIPPGFGDAVGGGAAHIDVLRSADRLVGGEIASALAEGFAAELEATRLATDVAVTAGAAGTPPTAERVREVAAAVAASRSPIRLVDGSVGTREVKAASYFGPSMAIFFVFFTVEFGALGILAERRRGTLARLLGAPISRSAVVVGKALGTFGLGLASLGAMIVATTFLLGASWGDPLAVAAIAVSTVLAAMAITGAAATFASTEERAGGFASIVTMALALLGGNFIPIDQAPDAMRAIALATPNGLALRAFSDLVAEGGGVVTAVPYVLGILAFAVVCGSFAIVRSRKLVLT